MYVCDEAIPPPHYGLHEPGLFGIVLKGLPNFADRSIDPVFGIEEDPLTPKAFNDFLASPDKGPGPLSGLFLSGARDYSRTVRGALGTNGLWPG